MRFDGHAVKDAFCASCGFRISEGVYAYMAGSQVFCQKCVKGPHPWGHEPMGDATIPTQRPALESLSPVSSPL